MEFFLYLLLVVVMAALCLIMYVGMGLALATFGWDVFMPGPFVEASYWYRWWSKLHDNHLIAFRCIVSFMWPLVLAGALLWLILVDAVIDGLRLLRGGQTRMADEYDRQKAEQEARDARYSPRYSQKRTSRRFASFLRKD